MPYAPPPLPTTPYQLELPDALRALGQEEQHVAAVARLLSMMNNADIVASFAAHLVAAQEAGLNGYAPPVHDPVWLASWCPPTLQVLHRAVVLAGYRDGVLTHQRIPKGKEQP